MGGAVSAGRDNDELVDNLVEADYIKSPLIQQVFRAVDRGNYYFESYRKHAYRDMAWRIGNIHLSAPCVYSEVMESLQLRPGLSFLNLGSGSGYLSTMVGLMLGPYGINHGVEMLPDVLEFAHKKLEEFTKNSQAFDEFDFCEPVFVQANCFQLNTNDQQYDRVYCGAACPAERENYVKHLVKVGGILVMPLKDKLLQMTRVDEATWETVKILNVNFAPLIIPSSDDPFSFIKLPTFYPPALQEVCRSKVRSILRRNIDSDYPNLKGKRRHPKNKIRSYVRRIVIPIFDESESGSSSNSRNNSDDSPDSDSGPEYTIGPHIPSRMTALLENFMRRNTVIEGITTCNRSLTRAHDTRNSSQQTRNEERAKEDSDNDDSVGTSNGNQRQNGTNKSAEPPTTSSSSSSSERDGEGKAATSSRSSANCPLPKKRPYPGSLPACARKRQYIECQPSTSANTSVSTSSSGQSSATQAKRVRRTATVIWKRITPGETISAPEKEEKEKDKAETAEVNNSDKENENYTTLMTKKIESLPLPVLIRKYINYRRDFNC